MSFIVKGLSAEPFRGFYGKSDAALAKLGVKRMTVDSCPGFPDRIEMRDAAVGETMLLLNHLSLDKQSPYRATHAIFVREGAEEAYKAKNTIPEVMFSRVLSLRAFDSEGMILDAALATGDEVKSTVLQLLANDAVEHIDAHNAARGCFSGRIYRD